MKTAAFLAGTGALLAAAGPIDKRAMETEWVTDYLTVWVTAGHEETSVATNVYDVPAEPTNVYTTVWVESQPETTSQAAVEYTTVWYSESSSSSEKAQATSVAVEYGSGSSDSSPTSATVSSAAPTSTGYVADFSLDGKYWKVMENYHNNHRANHSVGQVTWDPVLAAEAAIVAARCVFAHDTSVYTTSNTSIYGQNIASWGSTDAPTGAENKYGAISVTNQWYNSEVENWSFYGQANPPSDMNIDLYGHFTQVVWQNTQTVGCATQYCEAGAMYSFPAYYTVCNYQGAGNYGGEYGKNVWPSNNGVKFHAV